MKPRQINLTAIPKGERLVQLRGRRRQRDIESLAGLPYQRLTRMETGKPSSIDHVLLVANFYNVPARELVAEESLATIEELLVKLAQLTSASLSSYHLTSQDDNSLNEEITLAHESATE